MTPQTTRRVRFAGPNSVELTETPSPPVGADEALIRSRVSGICGSDLHALADKHRPLDSGRRAELYAGAYGATR